MAAVSRVSHADAGDDPNIWAILAMGGYPPTTELPLVSRRPHSWQKLVLGFPGFCGTCFAMQASEVWEMRFQKFLDGDDRRMVE